MRGKSFKAKDSGQNILLNYQYNYDKMDNMLNKATEHGDYAYDYDDIYRLIDADNPTLVDEAFAYDPIGNRLTAQGVAGTWTYNANNELSAYGDVTYEYDANGNMTQKTIVGVVIKFFYNTEDRLEQVEEGDGTLIAAYYYDPFGRRLWKEVSGAKTYFLYADEGLIGEYDSTGGEIKTYGYKPGSTWTTDPLFMKQGSSYFFYHTDHLGTPQKMTAVNGAVVWSAKYSSFGEATVDAASTVTNPIRFPGQFFDEETGLHYNYQRYYDPQNGRYITTDLYFNFESINLYLYCKNNPLDSIDPTGEWWVLLKEFLRYRKYIELSRDVTNTVIDLWNRKTKRELKELIDNNRKAAKMARDMKRETCHSDHKNCLRNKKCKEVCNETFRECMNNTDEKYYKDLKENVWPYENKYRELN